MSDNNPFGNSKGISISSLFSLSCVCFFALCSALLWNILCLFVVLWVCTWTSSGNNPKQSKSGINFVQMLLNVHPLSPSSGQFYSLSTPLSSPQSAHQSCCVDGPLCDEVAIEWKRKFSFNPFVVLCFEDFSATFGFCDLFCELETKHSKKQKYFQLILYFLIFLMLSADHDEHRK